MPVLDEAGELVGVLSERDCLDTLLDASYHDLPTAFVKDLMSTELVTVDPHVGIVDAAEMFLQNKVRRMPVVEGDKLVGQISRRDVLRAVRELHLSM